MDDHTRSCWPWLDHGLRRTHVLGEGGFGAVYLCHRRNKPGQDGQGPTRSSISRGYYGFLLCNCGYSWDETGQTCNMPMNSGNNHNDVWVWSFTMFSYSIQWWFWIIDGFFGVRLIPIVSTNIECQPVVFIVYPTGMVTGKATNWGSTCLRDRVCTKAFVQRLHCPSVLPEMGGKGHNLLIFVDKADLAKHWRLTTLFFFLQGTLSAHGGVLQIHRLISKVRRLSIFSLGMKLGEPLKSSGSLWFSLVDLLFGVVNPSHFQLSFP